MREHIKNLATGLVFIAASLVVGSLVVGGPMFVSLETRDSRWLIVYAPLVMPFLWFVGATIRGRK